MKRTNPNAETAAAETVLRAFERVFCAFLRGDAALLERVAACGGDPVVSGETLVFTLPGLYAFTCGLDDRPAAARTRRDRAGYLRFRQQIYAHPTTARLAAYGGRIEIERAGARHDETHYRLVRIAPTAAAASGDRRP